MSEGRSGDRGGDHQDAAQENTQEVEAITRLTKTRCRKSRHTRSISWTNTSLPPMMFEDEKKEEKPASKSSAAPAAARARPRRHSEHNSNPHSPAQQTSTNQPQASPRRRTSHHSQSPSSHKPPPEIVEAIPEHGSEAHGEDEDAADVLAQLQQPLPWHGSCEGVHPCRVRSNSDTGLLVRAGSRQGRDHNKTLAYWRLEKEYRLVKDKLVAKAEECDSLAQYKEQLTREMDDLTESLFEEAHNMVRTAKEETTRTEKRYVEAASKVEMLTAEVSALKTIVEHQREQLQPHDPRSRRLGAPAHSRGPSQTRTQSPTKAQRRASASPPATRSSGRGFRRHFFRRQNIQTPADAAGKDSKAAHKRQSSVDGVAGAADDPSTRPAASGNSNTTVQTGKKGGGGAASTQQGSNAKKGVSRGSSTSSRKEHDHGRTEDGSATNTSTATTTTTTEAAGTADNKTEAVGGADAGENACDDDDDAEIVDKRLLERFTEWYKKPNLNAPFIASLEQGEMTRTLNVCEPSSPIQIPHILAAIKEQSLVIECLARPSEGRVCAVTGRGSSTHRIRLGSQTEWIDVSETVRDRIASVCDCYVYLRYIQQGLVKVGAKRAFIKLAMHRQQMMNALLGLRLYESVL